MYQLQQVLNIIDLFTSQPKIDFYTSLFSNLDLSSILEFLLSKFVPRGYSRHALFSAIIIMEAEKFGETFISLIILVIILLLPIFVALILLKSCLLIGLLSVSLRILTINT